MSRHNSSSQESESGDDNCLNSETFHTPSFGDEDFDIPPLNIQSVSNSLSTQQSYSSQPLSHPPVGSMNLNHTDSLVNVAPKFPPQNFDVPDISISNSVMSSSDSIMSSSVTDTGRNIFSLVTSENQMMMSSDSHNSQSPLTTISQSDIATHLGFQASAKNTLPPSTGSNSSASPIRESSEDSDDSLPLAQLAMLKRHVVEETPSPEPVPVAVKKQKTPKKKKKKDPNEPHKPVSAYALFFRDTQAAIKGQNPSASFGEVSKIVASMWDGLDPDHKSVYKKKTEAAKKEYLKQLAAYRASLVSQAAIDEGNALMAEKSASPPRTKQLSPVMMGQSGGGNSMGMLGLNMGNSPQHMMNNSPLHVMRNSPQHTLGNSPQHTLGNSPLHTMGNSPQHPVGHSSQMMGQGYNTSPPHHLQHLNIMPQMQTGFDEHLLSPSMCVREGCMNHVIENPGWDNEYCSNDCVVSHCRDVFTAWIASRQGTNSFPVK